MENCNPIQALMASGEIASRQERSGRCMVIVVPEPRRLSIINSVPKNVLLPNVG
ncbi:MULTISPECIES: hypothetical protein [Sporolactobacillus]|uniref:hypothetical protein n=1 Tax=Sporolactobacillus TaxID=2077 RepID=UPI00159B9660|nr:MULTISPECIES: hypothetical protein [Sporolactobacillus]